MVIFMVLAFFVLNMSDDKVFGMNHVTVVPTNYSEECSENGVDESEEDSHK